MIGWLALGLLIGLLVGLALGARRLWMQQREEDRVAAWREVATEIDHAFSTSDAPHELDQLPLPLLSRIDADVVAPELTGPSEGGIQRLFTTSVDGHSVTIGVADLARPVPNCSLRPKGSEGPEVGAGWEPVDPGLVHIRSRFEIRGDDPAAINSFLDDEIGGWLAGEGTEWSIELAGNSVLIVRPEMPVERLGDVALTLDALRARLPWAAKASASEGKAGDDQSSGAGGGGKRKKRRRRKRGGGRGNSGGGQGGEQGGGAAGG